MVQFTSFTPHNTNFLLPFQHKNSDHLTFVNYDQHFKFEAKENVILDINMFQKINVLNTSY